MDNNKVYDASLDAEMEERNQVEFVRNGSESIKIGEKLVGNIESYDFTILIRDQPTFKGTLTRDEMNLIHNLYTSEGANLSQREVSRYFPRFTFQQFKRVLRAFNIIKASAPLAPHMIEEKTPAELVQLTLQNKENNFLKKLEQDRNRVTEGHLKDMTKKYYGLKDELSDFEEFLKNIKFDIKPLSPVKPTIYNDNTLVLYLSDMHIGASVSGYSIYDNTFDYNEAESRLYEIYLNVIKSADQFNITNIVVCNIGDSLDGYDGKTTRGGHQLPQNMNNKDQYKNYLNMMIQFFSDLTNSERFNTIRYVCVEGGNHDGDVGFMANKSLEACLAVLNSEIDVTIFEKMIDYFEVGKHAFILSHGKDAKDMFKNMPLTLNDKWENQINEYIDYNVLTEHYEHIHFVKGDLHQSATTYGKRFRYKSVGSFFGSSEWIHKNFGNTKAATDFDVIIGDDVFESRLVLN